MSAAAVITASASSGTRRSPMRADSDADGGDDVAVTIANRCGQAQDVGVEFTAADCVALCAGFAQSDQQVFLRGQRVGGRLRLPRSLRHRPSAANPFCACRSREAR